MYTRDQEDYQRPSTPKMNGGGGGGGGGHDVLPYKERFQNIFNKFSPNEEPCVGRGKPSHLEYLFDKAQGVGAGPSANNRASQNGHHHHHHDFGGKHVASPQPTSRVGQQSHPSMAAPPEDGGSISERAVPATPDFLKGSPLSSMTIKDSPIFPRMTSRTPDASTENESDRHVSGSTPTGRSARGSSESSGPLGSSGSSSATDRRGGSVSSGIDGNESSAARVRPSFEQARRHWVYTPKMSRPPEGQKEGEGEGEARPVERKKHPGARSRPLPEYLNFRKYSVPLVSPRPKVEVKQKAVDDQSPQKEMMRSLQKSSADIDCSSVHQLLREGDELSHYDEHSIRYTGRTNPSRVFQLLQSATGSEAENLAEKPPSRRRAKKQTNEELQQDADDIVDITYIGGNIPSRTFQCLKEAFDDRDSKDPFSSTELLEATSEPVRSVKVVHLRPRKSIDDGITSL